jgi:UBX domain-containing protein 7
MQMDMSPEGQTFVQRYQVNDFPHISIIDPRTGRLLWRKEGWTQQSPVTASSFAEMAMDFCSRNTFDRPPQAPRPPGGGGGASSGFRPPQKRPVHEMTEDEQLQEAMRASMQDASSADVQDDNSDDDEVHVLDASMDDSSDDAKPPPDDEKATSPLIGELLALQVNDEPPAGSRLALRMPDGKRVVRKFAPTDTVKTVYAFFAVRVSSFVRRACIFVLHLRAEISLTLRFAWSTPCVSNRTTKCGAGATSR